MPELPRKGLAGNSGNYTSSRCLIFLWFKALEHVFRVYFPAMLSKFRGISSRLRLFFGNSTYHDVSMPWHSHRKELKRGSFFFLLQFIRNMLFFQPFKCPTVLFKKR